MMFNAFVAFLILLAQLPSTSSIQGRVVVSGGQTGLARVSVELQRAGTNEAPVIASTTEDGRFAFANLVAGQYRLTATRSGYVPRSTGNGSLADRVCRLYSLRASKCATFKFR